MTAALTYLAEAMLHVIATRENAPHIVTITNDTRRVVVNRRRLTRTYIPTHASYRRIRAACEKHGRLTGGPSNITSEYTITRNSEIPA